MNTSSRVSIQLSDEESRALHGTGRPKRITMHVFTEGESSYLCGRKRRRSRVHKTSAWAMEATGEAVLVDCDLCFILNATMEAGR